MNAIPGARTEVRFSALSEYDLRYTVGHLISAARAQERELRCDYYTTLAALAGGVVDLRTVHAVRIGEEFKALADFSRKPRRFDALHRPSYDTTARIRLC
jgi:hypothetical protein